MDELLKKLTEYMSLAEKTVSTYAPQVWESTLRLIQFAGIYELAWGFVWIICLSLWSWYTIPWAKKYQKESDGGSWALYGIPALILLFFIGVQLGDLKHWLQAFAPELALMYSLAEKAGVL
jgi:hypothetical protein